VCAGPGPAHGLPWRVEPKLPSADHHEVIGDDAPYRLHAAALVPSLRYVVSPVAVVPANLPEWLSFGGWRFLLALRSPL
jgi:hypothetical protein